MQTIIVVLVLVGIVSFSVWFEKRNDNTDIAPSPKTSDSVADTITVPIEKAEEVKDTIEKTNLRTLDLSGKGLTSVPKDIFSKTELESLNLSQNKLTGALPAEVRHLQNLKVLNLSHNDFTGVPAEVGQLENLEVLDLSYNKLTGLPYEIGNLKNLKLLKLSGNDYAKADLAIIKEKLPASTIIETQ